MVGEHEGELGAQQVGSTGEATDARKGFEGASLAFKLGRKLGQDLSGPGVVIIKVEGLQSAGLMGRMGTNRHSSSRGRQR